MSQNTTYLTIAVDHDDTFNPETHNWTPTGAEDADVIGATTSDGVFLREPLPVTTQDDAQSLVDADGYATVIVSVPFEACMEIGEGDGEYDVCDFLHAAAYGKSATTIPNDCSYRLLGMGSHPGEVLIEYTTNLWEGGLTRDE